MAVALRGNLKDFGLAEVFQLIGQQRKTGLLEISSGRAKMGLAFAEGHVVWATPLGGSETSALGEMLLRCGFITREVLQTARRESSDSARSLPALLVSKGAVRADDVESIRDLVTHETIFDVLRWSKGSFHFSAQEVPHDRDPDQLLAAEQILMDGLRMVDEWQIFAGQVPTPETVFRRAGSFDVYRQRASGEARHRLEQAERVFHLVDGRLSARRVIDLSRLGTFEATRILAELREADLIEVMDAARVRAVKRARRDQPPVARQVGLALAALLPLLLLGLLVSTTDPASPTAAYRPSFLSEAPAGQRIPRRPLAAARQAFATRGVQHAVEAHRFLSGGGDGGRGEWPATLQALSGDGVLSPPALATPSGRAYYYEWRKQGPLLLAPEL